MQPTIPSTAQQESPTASRREASSVAPRELPPRLPHRRTSWLAQICLAISVTLFLVVFCCVVRQLSDTATSDEIAGNRPESHIVPVVANPTRQNSPITSSTSPSTKFNERIGVPAERPATKLPSTAKSVDVATNIDVESRGDDLFGDLRQRKYQLELPDKGSFRTSIESTLASIVPPEGQQLKLTLKGEAAQGLRLMPQTDGLADEQSWTVIKEARASFGGVENVKIGRFIFRNHELCFQWNPDAPPWARPASLQLAQLELSIGNRQQVCQLWRPITVPPLQIDLRKDHKVHQVDVPLPGQLIEYPEKTRIQFQLVQSGQEKRSMAAAVIGEAATIQLGDDDENSVEVQLTITTGSAQSLLEIKFFGSPPVMEKDGSIHTKRREITPAIVQNVARSGQFRNVKKREAEIEKLKISQSNIQKQITQKESAAATANLAGRTRLEAEVTSLNQDIAVIEIKIEKMESDMSGLKAFAEKTTTWCDNVERILRSLEHRATLHYAVYVPTEPRTVVIESTGFEWGPR